MTTQEWIETYGHYAAIHITLDRADVFAWETRIREKYGDTYDCQVTHREELFETPVPVYVAVAVLTLKRRTIAPEVALTAVSSALAAMHIQKTLDAGGSVEIPSLGLILRKEEPRHA